MPIIRTVLAVPTLLLVAGVTGSGKATIAKKLLDKLEFTYLDVELNKIIQYCKEA